jgi:hypothetical protein
VLVSVIAPIEKSKAASNLGVFFIMTVVSLSLM